MFGCKLTSYSLTTNRALEVESDAVELQSQFFSDRLSFFGKKLCTPYYYMAGATFDKSCDLIGCFAVRNPPILDRYSDPYAFGRTGNFSINKQTTVRQKERPASLNKNELQKRRVSRTEVNNLKGQETMEMFRVGTTKVCKAASSIHSCQSCQWPILHFRSCSNKNTAKT